MADLIGNLAFLGAGRMASALAEGIVAAGVVAPEKVVASDPSSDARERFANRVAGARTIETNAAAVDGAGLVMLAVKPQFAAAVLREVSALLPPKALVVSIAAGVTLDQLESALPAGAHVVRVMPNTPSLIGRGAAGFSLGAAATEADAQLVLRLFESVGYAVRVDESQLDAVTGVSGSGPAFVYTVVEAMADAGVRAGLPRPTAVELAARTVAGAAEMVAVTGEHPAALRDAVTSPGGTTAAGLAELEHHGLPWALHAAIDAAIRRSQELADG